MTIPGRGDSISQGMGKQIIRCVENDSSLDEHKREVDYSGAEGRHYRGQVKRALCASLEGVDCLMRSIKH